MKKKILKLNLFALAIMFVFLINVNAEGASISCPKTAEVGKPFTCKVTTDQTVYIASELRVYKGSTMMSENGNIEFKASEEKEYDIGVISEDGMNTFDTATVNVKAVTTSKTTTTTTTKAKSDNNYLSSITVDGIELKDFSKTKTKYFIELDNDVTRANISAEAEDNNAKVEIDGPKTLEVGDNEFTISVTSESNTTKFYKVIVTRKEEEKEAITDISNIKIKGYKLNFDKSSKTFYLKINKETTKLDIEVTLKDENANYDIEGNEDLKAGSVIKIIVTAENKDTDTYRIIIEKNESSILPIVIGICALLVIIGVIIFIVIKKKKNNNKKDNKNANKITEKIEEPKKSYDEEKTIEMPSISQNEVEEVEEAIPVDNDEEEPTRMLSYAERQELERNNIINDDLENKLDEEIEKTLSFSFDENDNDEY